MSDAPGLTIVEARIHVRLLLGDDAALLPALIADADGSRRRIKPEEVIYERDLLTGVEDLDVRGRPTTGRHRSGAELAAGTLAEPSEEQRNAWLVQARQIAAGLTGERREQ